MPAGLDSQVITPWSTVYPYTLAYPTWVDGQDAERLAAYDSYHRMYWSESHALTLIRRNDDGLPVYVPRPKMIVDTTAHYLLKGLHIGVTDPGANPDMVKFIENFCIREKFYSRFHTAKLKGVVMGDWLMHITADPNKDPMSRISLTSIDPASYFPEYDSDDLDKLTGAKILDMSEHPDNPAKTVVKILRYWYQFDDFGERIDNLVWREENLWEMEGWNNEKEQKLVKVLIEASPLPPEITTIPVYHFRNAEWDGYQFGNSELKGYERIFAAIDQAISDEEISLALVGLGVYATDAGRPKDAQGVEQDWIVAPGTVWEMPGATMVKRLEGISTVTPVLDHVRYLEGALLDASGTSQVALGNIDVQTAESGIALALKFMPTLAKIEVRDTAGVEVLTQMWYDWKFWILAYEEIDFTAIDIVISLGEKLPVNRSGVIEELNNLVDRKIISRKFYRDQLTAKLGYVFPDDIEQQILDEQKAQLELAAQFAPPTPDQTANDGSGRKVGAGDTIPPNDRNASNNKGRTNESNGTEVK